MHVQPAPADTSTRPPSPSSLEWGIAFGVLFLMTKAVLMLALTRGDPQALGLADGSALYQVLAALAYLTCGVLVLRRPGRALEMLHRNKLLMALLLVALLSVAWSVSPAVTMRRVIGLVGTIIVALFIASRFTTTGFLRLLHALFLSLALLSVLAVALLPDLAIHADLHAGAWRGVFAHKNNLGEAMAMGVAVSALLLSDRRTRGVAMLGVVACGAMLVMSASRASWVAAFVALLAIHAVRVFSLSFWLRIPAMLSLATLSLVGGWALWVNLEDVLALIGRDLTLTGRTLLWASAFVAGLDRPFLGHGYRAFWLGASGGVAGLGSSASDFAMQIDHGHNGFLDIWLELGLVGLLLFLCLFLGFAWRALRLARTGVSPEQRWPIVLFVLLLPVSFATTVILDRNNYYWIVFVATLLYSWGARTSALREPGSSGASAARRTAG